MKRLFSQAATAVSTCVIFCRNAAVNASAAMDVYNSEQSASNFPYAAILVLAFIFVLLPGAAAVFALIKGSRSREEKRKMWLGFCIICLAMAVVTTAILLLIML